MIPRFSGRVSVTLEAYLQPTEDVEKVQRAMRNILGSVEGGEEGSEGRLRLRAEGVGALQRLYRQLRYRRILAGARRLLLEHAGEGRTWLYLNKQAAFMGIAALCEDASESPLGPITLSLESDNIQSLVDWLAPPRVSAQPKRYEVGD